MKKILVLAVGVTILASGSAPAFAKGGGSGRGALNWPPISSQEKTILAAKASANHTITASVLPAKKSG